MRRFGYGNSFNVVGNSSRVECFVYMEFGSLVDVVVRVDQVSQ